LRASSSFARRALSSSAARTGWEPLMACATAMSSVASRTSERPGAAAAKRRSGTCSASRDCGPSFRKASLSRALRRAGIWPASAHFGERVMLSTSTLTACRRFSSGSDWRITVKLWEFDQAAFSEPMRGSGASVHSSPSVEP
jgi:hypothetical protein